MWPGQHCLAELIAELTLMGLGAPRASSALLLRDWQQRRVIYNGPRFTRRIRIKSVFPWIPSVFHSDYFINMDKTKSVIMLNYVNLQEPSVSGHCVTLQVLPRLPQSSCILPVLLHTPHRYISRSCCFSFALWWAWEGLGAQCLLVSLQYSQQHLCNGLGARKLKPLHPRGNLNRGEVSSINMAFIHSAA